MEATKEEKIETDEVKEKKVEADHQMLANPARVLPQQVNVFYVIASLSFVCLFVMTIVSVSFRGGQ